MLKKSLIAAAALATVVTLASTSAKADPDIFFGIGFGSPGYHHPRGDFFPPPPGFLPPPPPVYAVDPFPADYGYRPHHRRHRFVDTYVSRVSCDGGANILRRAGFRGVEADDCSAPTYSYQAWRHGEQFDIQVSSRGRIISVDPAY
jgi:hypothetical protein